MNNQTPSNKVYSRSNPWLGRIVDNKGALFFEFPASADTNHEPRTFSVPVTQTHLQALKNLQRHILLVSVLTPLGDAAGTDRPLDESKAVKLLNTILVGSEDEVASLLKDTPWDNGILIASNADRALLEQGNIIKALHSVTEKTDWMVAWDYFASRKST
jgi:hypothetical protein